MFLFSGGLKRKRENEDFLETAERERKKAPFETAEQGGSGSHLGTAVYSALVRIAGTIGISGAKDLIRFTSKGLQSQLSNKQQTSSYVSVHQGGESVFSPETQTQDYDTSLMSPPPLFDRSTSPRGASPFSSSFLNKPMQSILSQKTSSEHQAPSSSPPEVKTSLTSLHALRRKSAVVAAFKAEKESQNSLIILPRNVPFPQVATVPTTPGPVVDDSSSALLMQHERADSAYQAGNSSFALWAPVDAEINDRISRAKSALFEALAPAANDRENVLKYIDQLINTSTSSMSARASQEPAFSTTPKQSLAEYMLFQPKYLKVDNDTTVIPTVASPKSEDVIDLLDDDDDIGIIVRGTMDPLEQWRKAVVRMDSIVPRHVRENAIRSSSSSNIRLSEADVSRLASCLFPFQEQEELLKCCPGGPLGIAGRVGKDSVTWRSIQCLIDNEWLNDEVINIEAKRISLQVRNSGIWVTSSHFYSKLAESAPFGTLKGTTPGYSFENVKRWTEKENIDIKRLKAIVIPLHVLPVHWAVIVINLQKKSLHFFDSLFAPKITIDVNLGNVLDPSPTVVEQLGQFGPALMNCARWVKDEFAARGNPSVDVSTWKGVVHNKSDVPQQGNSLDCGVYCLHMTKILANGRGPCFDEGTIVNCNVGLLRRQIALSIVNS
jgi:hypothetical protein